MQFALHYMFQSRRKFHGFLRNVAECTKMGGVFVGTCFDGRSVFGLLRDTAMGGEVVERAANGERRWAIAKEYDDHITTLPDTEESLGMQITVFQDSIGQGIKEWLVSFNLLVSAMDKYGFVVVTKEEAVEMGLPEGSATFQTLFSETALDGRLKTMTPEEKRVSFLNRYFVFKKVRDVDGRQMEEAMLLNEPEEEEELPPVEDELPMSMRPVIRNAPPPVRMHDDMLYMDGEGNEYKTLADLEAAHKKRQQEQQQQKEQEQKEQEQKDAKMQQMKARIQKKIIQNAREAKEAKEVQEVQEEVPPPAQTPQQEAAPKVQKPKPKARGLKSKIVIKGTPVEKDD
jgi:hypothetical protein